MIITISDIDIYYEEVGNGPNLIFLHGWGNDLRTFSKQIDAFKDKYHLYLIDLPGFGKTLEPMNAYTLDNYVNIIKEFIFRKNIINPVIVGHSFGGRIGIKLANKIVLNGLILISSAGINHNNIRKIIKKYQYKLKKYYYKITKNYLEYNFLIKNSGSKDYISLSSTMKETMSHVIKENLRNKLKNIKCNTLLIWGSEDCETPLIDGKIMKKEIKNSLLYVIDKGTHFVHLEYDKEVNDIIERFLSDLYE